MSITRRTAQVVLGIIWFVDGLLQLKPQMFTHMFITMVILPTAQSQPAWISHSVQWAANLVNPHVGIYDILFAGTQLLIGLCLIINFRVKTTLIASFVWTLIVWWFGEGFGQIFTGKSLVLTGAPGAAFLYGMIGLVLYPRNETDDQISPQGKRIARYTLGFLWILGGVLQLQTSYLNSNGLAGAFSAGWVSHIIGTNSLGVGVALAVIQFVLGVGIIFNLQVRPLLWISMILSLVFWWIGQSFGQMFTSMGTDPNAGPLFVLLALTSFPTASDRHQLVKHTWPLVE